MLQEDRLKAFLERNRNRLATKPESSNVTALQNSQLIQSDIIKTSNTESSKPSSTNAIDNILLQDIKQDPKVSSTQDVIRKQRKDYPEMQNNSQYFSTTSSDSLAYHIDNRSSLTGETPQKNLLANQSQTKGPKMLKQSKTFESSGTIRKSNTSRNNMSISPSKSLQWDTTPSSKSKNRIEDYIKSRKESRNKIRERVRSLSNESTGTLRPLRSSLILNSSSLKNRPYDSNSRSSIANETQDFLASTKSNAFDRLSRSQILFDSFPSRPKKSYTSAKKTTIKAKGTKETKEFCFEEAEDGASRNKNILTTKARSKSRSSNVSPIRSLIDKTKKETSTENFKARLDKEKSRDKSVGKQAQKFFPESSKKLSILDSSLDNGHKFKKEIKTLIGVIKKEREQIGSELEHMSSELKKYKAAYKSLKKEVSSGKKATVTKDGKQTSSYGDFSNISRSRVEDKSIVKDQEKISYPFTINELTQYIQNSVPVQNEENIEDLLANIDSVHTDVETILKRSEFESRSPQRRLPESKTFELRRTPVNCFIIKDMNLPPSLFFQDTYPEESIESKPNLIDLLAAQREVIYFLVKKLEIEEQQRLKTEEQASKMVFSMEKTIKSLEGKSGVKRTEPSSQLDLNKSGISHISYKSDNVNQTIE